jgi:hypothetical protein
MKQVWLSVLVGVMACGIAMGGTFNYPEKKSAFTIDFPNKWKTSVNEQEALESLSPDETIYILVWEVEDLKAVEKEVEDTLNEICTDFKEDTEDREVTNKAGIEFSLTHGKAKDKETQDAVQITVGVFAPVEGRVMIVVYTIAENQVTVKGEGEFEKIMQSIKPAK